MAKSVRDLEPGIPQRGVSRDQSAGYIGVSAGTWDSLVDDGIMPPPLPFPIKRKLWDLQAIDAALDRYSGVGSSSSEDERRVLGRLDAYEREIRRTQAE